MPRRIASESLRVLGASVAMAIAVGLTACSPDTAPEPDATSSSAPEQSPSPEPEAPQYLPEGSADDNLPLFAAVTAQVWAGDQRGSGRAYIDALVASGFDRAAMQLTSDRTTVGNAAESLQFSVRWGDAECLIGQVGSSTGEPVTAVMPQLAEGRCLIGNTQPINW